MSRVEAHGDRYSLAYGVDHLPDIGAFVQVWDRSKGVLPDPDSIVEEHDRSTTGGYNLTEEFVLDIARKYDVPLDVKQVYQVFD